MIKIEYVLTTPRLYLRQFTLADAALIYELNKDPEVLKYLPGDIIKDEAHAKEVLLNIILPQYENKLGRWAVHLKSNDEFIGWCGLKYLKELNEIDLGYRFAKKYWGNGYAYESAKYVLEYGFTTLNLKEIVGRAHIDNIASLKVLEKIGMQYVKDEILEDLPHKNFMAKNPNSLIPLI